jgi:hypothetical protein
MPRSAGVLLVLLAVPPIASAQPAERAWISINAVGGTGAKSFTDSVQTPLYQETETITTTYPAVNGLVVSSAGGVRVWKQLSVGAGVSHLSRTGEAAISASLPHPFFDNQPRAVSGQTGATHEELGFDVKIAWTAQLAPTVRLILSGGPSVITVHQTIVTGVQYSESYPYDTAQFTSAVTTTATKAAPGVNAAADVFWLFSRHLGAGGIIQVAHATVTLSVDSRSIPIDAGGFQAGGGIRFVF